MDAARYFEMMHRAMSARKRDTTLLLRVKVQDLGGADAYLELRQEPGSARVRLFYSTMGRRNLNFQLFRKGWQLCHNASGEMTGRFPAKADELLSADDFAAYLRRPHRRPAPQRAGGGAHHGGQLCRPGCALVLLEHRCRRPAAHGRRPLLAGRFPGRDGAAHPPILPGGRPAGRSVAGRPCFALCLPGGPDAPANGPRRSGCCPPRFCTACAEPPMAEHPRRAGNGIRNARRTL